MSPEELSLPLHAKCVQPLDLAAFLLRSRPFVVTRIRTLLQGLVTAGSPFEPVGSKWRIPPSDLLALRQADVLEPFSGPLSSPTLYFSVVELAKGRRRPIMWPRVFHENFSRYVSDFSLPHTPIYADCVHEGSLAAAFDLASSFWQILLPSDINFVLTDHAGRPWRMTRLPFGVDCASEIVHLIVSELAFLSAPTLCIAARRVHIDNVLFVAGSDIDSYCSAFKSICSELNVTLNDEPSNVPAAVIPFAGMCLDFSLKRVRLNDKFINSIPDPAKLRTYMDLERFVGKLLYGSAVLRLRLHPFHWFIKVYRRRLSMLSHHRLSWLDPVNLPPLATQAIHQIHAQVSRNAWTTIPSPASPFSSSLCDDGIILVTDATLNSFGAVLYEAGVVVSAYGGSFPHSAPSMAVAESAAILAAVSRFSSRLRSRSFVLLVDNTSAQHAIASNKGKHHALDLAADRVHSLLSFLGARVLVSRISSRDNVADAPSRGLPLKDACIQASKAAADAAVRLVLATGAGADYATLRGGDGGRPSTQVP